MVKKIILAVLVIAIIVLGVVFRAPLVTMVRGFISPPPELVVSPGGDFTVNLLDPGMRRYLRVNISLQHLSSRALTEELVAREPEVRHAVIKVLRAKTVEDLTTTEKVETLRQELLSALNAVLERGDITNLFFVDFVIQ
ncbi:MAG: flagellar basal body-associated FliL family protein [Selenomonadales bacterium]|jgi:flagellar FliL protein|nr:flagellar basal body-associated FliL family protein [Selenomonadales bacterium]